MPTQDEKSTTRSKYGMIWKIVALLLVMIFIPYGWLIVLLGVGVWLFITKRTPKAIEDAKNIINELPEEDSPEINPSAIFSGEQGLDIPSCVTYFAQLKRKYTFHDNTWNPIRQKLIHIKKRYTDPLLYLGVIGEASAGKSSFINALLGIEFLKEDTSLGTTTAATILKYGEEFSTIINYSDGRPSMCLNSQLAQITSVKDIIVNSKQILDIVHKYTAEETAAENVYSVEISLPLNNKFLRSGVAIVDTPGLNSGNKRHDNVTTRTIREICDTALILIPANVPLSENLGVYVRENLLDVMSRCVLVMTQADTLRREKERSMQLSYISKRLQSATGNQVAARFCSSAYYVLDRDDYGKYNEEAVASFRKEFLKMTEALYELLSAGRKTAVTQNILVFLKNDLIPVLSDLLNTRKREYQERRKALQDNQLLDLDCFITEKIKQNQDKISNVIITEQAIIDAIDSVKDDFYSIMCRRINNATDRDGLKNAMAESYIRTKISELQNPLRESLTKTCAPLNNTTANALKSFHEEFVEAYKRLQNISAYSNSSSISSISAKGMDISISVGNFGDRVDTQLGADVMKTAGGAGAGAVIGSFICPGLGTAIGAVIGGVLGFLFRKSLDELKSEARGTISSIATDWKNQMIAPAHAFTEQYRQACLNMLKDKIEKYKSKYQNKISQMIAKEKAEQDKLLSFTNLVENDIDLLSRVKPEAESMLAQLQSSFPVDNEISQ